MALLSSEDKFKPILEVAQGLLHNGLPELALPLLASIIKERMVFKTLVHKHVLTATVLVSYMASYRDHKDEIIAWKTSFNSFKVLRAADLIFLLLSLLLVSLKLMGL